MFKISLIVLFFFAGILFCQPLLIRNPTVYIIGDSTVADSPSSNGPWGWGGFTKNIFDTTKINIRNYALGGTSSRSFYTGGIWDPTLAHKGLWDSVKTKLKRGDYLIIQFGHNDGDSIIDSTRQRGSIKGTGADTLVMFNKFLKRTEVVHSYGWYLTQMIEYAKSCDVEVFVCSPIPRNIWSGTLIRRDTDQYTLWAKQVAYRTHSFYINLNGDVANIYDKEGKLKVMGEYFGTNDLAHTTQLGASLNAGVVKVAIAKLSNCHLKNYLNKKLPFTTK